MFFCADLWSAKVFSMLNILIDRWQVLSYLIRVPMLNQVNHAIWQKSWFTSRVIAVFHWSLKVNASKEEKSLSVFVLRLQEERRRQNRFAAKEWALKLAESDKGSSYNQEKCLKDNKAPEKPIQTTAESRFTSPLASGARFLCHEAAKRETKSLEVPRHIKIERSTVLKVYCSGKEASRKTPGSGLLSIFPAKCRTFKKCIE